MQPNQVKIKLCYYRKEEVPLVVSEESQAITALVFALDNSGPASSEFTQPIVPSVLQPCTQPIHNQ